MNKIKMKHEKLLKNPSVVGLLAMICCLLWGSAFASIKIGYRMYDIAADETAAQILFAGCRFTLAGIFVICFHSLNQKRLVLPAGSGAWSKAGKLSLIQTVAQYLFFYIGLAHTTGVKASMIGGTNIFISIVLASLVFRQEKLTGRKIIGCVAGLIGVILIHINGQGLDLSFHLTGEGFIFFSAVAYALSSVFIKRYSEKEDPVMLSGYQFLIGGILMSICGAAAGGRLAVTSVRAAAVLAYLALISAVAYTLWGVLLKYNPVSKVAVFAFMTPLFGVLLSMLLLPEQTQSFGIKDVIALLLVCAGIYIVNHAPQGRWCGRRKELSNTL